MTEFNEGYKACKKTNGVRVVNPYATATPESVRWEDGWQSAMDEIKSEEE